MTPRWLATSERQWCAAERRWFDPSTCRGACLACRRQLIAEQDAHDWADERTRHAP